MDKELEQLIENSIGFFNPERLKVAIIQISEDYAEKRCAEMAAEIKAIENISIKSPIEIGNEIDEITTKFVGGKNG